MSDSLHFEDFRADGARMAAFHQLGQQIHSVAAPEPPSPDARCLLAWRDGQPVARLSYETVECLQGVAGACGLVGHYEAVDAAAGVAALRCAQRRLVEAGAVQVIGPMNGSTWANYRLALPAESGDPALAPPPFFAEPHNPAQYPEHFESAGFSVAARYESRIVEDLSTVRPTARALAGRIERTGLTVRPLDPRRLEEDLQALYHFSAAIFTSHPYYRPIDDCQFRRIYLQLQPLLDLDLVRLAHDPRGRLLGFLFAIPDVVSGAPGQPTRVILKTTASAPDARRLGLSAHLTDEVHRLAHQKGYQAAIHALMHAENDSVKISARYRSRLFRRYALYQWKPG